MNATKAAIFEFLVIVSTLLETCFLASSVLTVQTLTAKNRRAMRKARRSANTTLTTPTAYYLQHMWS